MVRMTIPTAACCWKILTRKRATPGREMAKLHQFAFEELALDLVHQDPGQLLRHLGRQLLR